jgi:hypothetical protein
MGRPRKIMNNELVVRLAARGYVAREIALYCGISEATLFRRCADPLQRGYLLRDASLRKKQFEVAMNGNPTMLIWLGKNLLSQTDRQELTGAGGGPIQYERTDLRKLSDEELAQLESLVEKAHAEFSDARRNSG